MKYHSKEWLIGEYLHLKKSASQIAREQGVSIQTICNHLKKNGIPVRQYTGQGDENPNWKGGRFKDKDGYVYVYSPEHPFRTANNVVFEHRLVMEAHLGRYLDPSEVVHHKNNKKDDNCIENLELSSPGEHMSHHAKERLETKKRDKKGQFIN